MPAQQCSSGKKKNVHVSLWMSKLNSLAVSLGVVERFKDTVQMCVSLLFYFNGVYQLFGTLVKYSACNERFYFPRKT